MTQRTQLFEAIRPFAKDQRFSIEEVNMIDKLADGFGIARGEAAGLRPSAAAIDNIKRWEGCKLTAYPDPGSGGDPWTIGYGATGPGIKPGVVWSQQQANERLVSDVEKFATQVAALVSTAPTTQGQFDALVSLAYNIGARALAESTLLRLHKEGDYAGAAAQFARWNKAGGRVLPGLTNRREAEAKIYRGQS
ncbi:hypothetical protein BH11PSE6_BH11PSE6_00060 [soil metagenome]